MPHLLDNRAGLQGKVAAVIGGAGGIGRVMTLALAECGVDVLVMDRDEAAVATIGEAVAAHGRRCVAMVGDVCDIAAIPAFYERVANETERLDIALNVAGGVRRTPFLDTSAETDAADIRRNYGYVIDSVKAAVPLIRRSGGGGSIVNFTTVEAHRGAAGFAVYAGAKAATTNFSKAVAVELACEKIRVNTLVPDTTPSDGNRAALPQADRDAMAALPDHVRAQAYAMYIPMQAAPQADDLANAMLFLASDLSRFVTGSSIVVDGGTLAASGFVHWPHGDGRMPAPKAGTLSRLFAEDMR